MQTTTVLVAALFALTSFPFLGQGSTQDKSLASPATQQTAPEASQTPAGASASQTGSADPSATSEAEPAVPSRSAPDLKPVSAELMGNLDSKTAKAGDSVVVLTESSVKTADGIEIPKGTKLVGHVVGAQASTGADTSQVAVQFDHAELAGGKSVPIQSQIQSVGSADAASNSAPAPNANAADRPGTSSPNNPASATPNSAAPGQSRMGSGPQPEAAAGASSGSDGGLAPGTVVATTGRIDIRTTAIPGVLVANNQPGQQDPRMAHASSVLLGARKDVQLGGGTPLVMGVATAVPAAETQ